MPQHSFSHKAVLTYLAATDYHAQSSALLSKIKSMHNHQPICLTNRQKMKFSYTGQLPNLSMLDSDSNKTQISPNVNKISLVSLEKLRYENYGVKLIKNQ